MLWTVSPVVEQPSKSDLEYAEKYIAKFDANGDGIVLREEVPRIVRDYSFWYVDTNHDGRVTRDELLQAARIGRGR